MWEVSLLGETIHALVSFTNFFFGALLQSYYNDNNGTS